MAAEGASSVLAGTSVVKVLADIFPNFAYPAVEFGWSVYEIEIILLTRKLSDVSEVWINSGTSISAHRG